MRRADTVIIGGGQAGLAMSQCLSDRGIDHVILERGRVGERWRSERWDSLRLLTPNWQSRLPGWNYQGSDPDGYMTMPEVISYLEGYARSTGAPVEDGTNVEAVEFAAHGYQVTTTQGIWRCSNVVVATGYCDQPYIPEMAGELEKSVFQLTPTEYRNPGQLPEGGVLVVGASASGIQLADEIHASGRPVTLAVGRHTRLPRMYRGRDILWWLDVMGVLEQGSGEVYDIEVSRSQPSLQLVGRPDHSSLDLPILQDRGVRLVGKVKSVKNQKVSFSDDLVAFTAAADAKLASLLGRIDDFINRNDLEGEAGPKEPFSPFLWPAIPPDDIDLRAEGIEAVLWATGFRRNYPWLKIPVLDERGEIRHCGGITAVPGLYVIGLQFLRCRKSAFIDGVGDDAVALADHISNRSILYRNSAA